MDEFAQLKSDLAAGKGDAPRQRGRGWRRFRDGYGRIQWRDVDGGANSDAGNHSQNQRPRSR